MNKEEFLNRFMKVPVVEFPNECVERPKISICIQTYNHVNYIEQCLESILNQTEKNIEILLSEDDSSDGTRDVCIAYAKRYPSLIRLFLHNRDNNITIEGKPTGRFCFLFNMFMARGEYIALCEGDDFWTDNKKLSKQLKVLELNPEAMACYHRYSQMKEGELRSNESDRFMRFDKFEYSRKLQGIQTMTFVFRNSGFSFECDYWPNLIRGTKFLYVDLNRFGSIEYIDEDMAVYRIHSTGIWSGVDEFQQAKMELENMLLMLRYFKSNIILQNISSNYKLKLNVYNRRFIRNGDLSSYYKLNLHMIRYKIKLRSLI